MRRAVFAVISVGSVAMGLIAAVPAANAATTPTAPPGYRLVSSGSISAPSGPLDSGTDVPCPAGTVVWGGGAIFSGGIPNFGNNINTSAPSGTGWRARYNNNTGRTAAFAVNAICAQQPKGYTVAFAAADNPPMTQSTATAMCPTGTVLLSGGALSTSDSAAAFLTSAAPNGPHKYTATVWNGTARDEHLTTFAICGAQPPHYTVKKISVSAPFGVDSGGMTCPAGSSVIGGGVQVLDPTAGDLAGRLPGRQPDAVDGRGGQRDAYFCSSEVRRNLCGVTSIRSAKLSRHVAAARDQIRAIAEIPCSSAQ